MVDGEHRRCGTIGEAEVGILMTLIDLAHSLRLFSEQGSEVPRGDDPGALMSGEHEQAGLVAGDEIIRVPGLRQSQQVVVAAIA